MRGPRFVVAVLAILGSTLLVGCASSLPNPSPAFGPVRSESDAVAAARLLTKLSGPLQIQPGVEHGTAGKLYTGVRASPADADQEKAFEAVFARTAWRVDTIGLAAPNACSTCTPVPWKEQLVIDEQTGTLLLWAGAPVP